MTHPANAFESKLTVFMLLKTAPEWLSFTVPCVRALAQEALTPILKKHASKITLRYFDAEPYCARVTDIWIWCATDVDAYHHLLADLRKDVFWNRYFKVVEILAGTEETHAVSYYRGLTLSRGAPRPHDRRPQLEATPQI